MGFREGVRPASQDSCAGEQLAFAEHPGALGGGAQGLMGGGAEGGLNPGSKEVFSVVPSATLLKRQVSKLYGGGSFSGPSSKMPPPESCRLPGSPTLERPATEAMVH